ncbi:aspartate aminotransferase, cytoplasmic-like [Pelobates fuscus]|uniref:aspartate aminotransferase, cytoplasmic-like n=1 Tax=Pelobates fuscus TaxID=191477 RepID=UPI002FE4CC96
MTSLSVFIDIPEASCEKENLLDKAFANDTNATKVFLGQRVFLSENGHPWVPRPVQKVCLQLLNDPTLNYEIEQGLGPSSFIDGASKLVFGRCNIALMENRVGGIQTLGSTGALRVGAEFLVQWYNTNVQKKAVCLMLSTCDEYSQIFKESGFTDIYPYRFWNRKTRCLSLSDMLEDLKKSPDYSIVFLQIACCPTGIEITNKDWLVIATLMKEKNMFPFFHLKAQGLASGDVDKDVWPIRYFVDEGFELFCAQSFSTNFGLYGERVGSLLAVLRSNEVLISVRSQLERILHVKALEPPAFGSRLVSTVLNNASYCTQWKESLKLAVRRLMLIRAKMNERLKVLGSWESWEHITQQTGPFTYTGLTPARIDFLAKEKHIYLKADGSMNITCLNPQNLEYVMQCILETTHQIPEEDSQSD